MRVYTCVHLNAYIKVHMENAAFRTAKLLAKWRERMVLAVVKKMKPERSNAIFISKFEIISGYL